MSISIGATKYETRTSKKRLMQKRQKYIFTSVRIVHWVGLEWKRLKVNGSISNAKYVIKINFIRINSKLENRQSAMQIVSWKYTDNGGKEIIKFSVLSSFHIHTILSINKYTLNFLPIYLLCFILLTNRESKSNLKLKSSNSI